MTTHNRSQTFWKDKNVLITGSTAGLGKAIALRLADKEANIAVVARGKEGLELISKHKRIYQIQADMGAVEDIHKIFSQAAGLLGEIDVLINNASSLGPVPLRRLIDIECEDFEEVLQVNLLGPFRLTKLVLSNMLIRDNGLILNISSDAARAAYPTWGPYSVSKIALDHMTRIWQQELNDTGVKLLAVDPGDMATEMHFNAIPDANADELYQPKDVAQHLIGFLELADFDQVRYAADEWRKVL